jgi:preprotein translocase subunit SecE
MNKKQFLTTAIVVVAIIVMAALSFWGFGQTTTKTINRVSPDEPSANPLS